jgi:hypothetical protein
MPLSLHRPRSYWKFAILLVCLAFGIWLTSAGYHGRLRYPTLWTFGYLVLLVVLVRTNVIESRASAKGSSIGIWGRLSDIVKGAACMFAGVGWGVLALGFVPQTPVGLAIVLVPFGGLLLVGAFLLVRGYIKNLQ